MIWHISHQHLVYVKNPVSFISSLDGIEMELTQPLGIHKIIKPPDPSGEGQEWAFHGLDLEDLVNRHPLLSSIIKEGLD